MNLKRNMIDRFKMIIPIGLPYPILKDFVCCIFEVVASEIAVLEERIEALENMDKK